MLAQDTHAPRTVHGAQWEKKGQQHQFGKTGFHVFFFCFGTCAIIKHKGKLIPQAKQLPVKIDTLEASKACFKAVSFIVRTKIPLHFEFIAPKKWQNNSEQVCVCVYVRVFSSACPCVCVCVCMCLPMLPNVSVLKCWVRFQA